MPKTTLDQKTFYGQITIDDFAHALVAEFHQGSLLTKVIGKGDQRIVQIASPPQAASGGRTAISVHLTKVENGVHVRVGQQDWIGVATSMGFTALTALRRPTSLLHRLDDLAQDLASLQLSTRIWATLSSTAASHGAAHELSDRLRRLMCEYCLTANPVGAPHCIACGAPLGPNQPVACTSCGNLLDPDETVCPECSASISPKR
ncbi:MAG: zinc ribbon domain-containing protein [Anaerolineales bacterium]|nr:zinc ribbon domain-containing protein [Anaerolineales bacterium]